MREGWAYVLGALVLAGWMAPVLAEFDTAHCGPILDVQLDAYGQCLATASADGHIRLWDVQAPEVPAFLSDLGAHSGAVRQVAWAPPEAGASALLASAGADGHVVIWGPCLSQGTWRVVHDENLSSHGAVQAISWASSEVGTVLACASADGTLSTVMHQGTVRSGDSSIDHRWQCQSFAAHKGQATAVSWASTSMPSSAGSLVGTSLASAGDDGVHVWRIDMQGPWHEERIEGLPAQGMARDVAWKPWDGSCEMLACAKGRQVEFLRRDPSQSGTWRVAHHVDFDEEVWKLQWMDIESQLLVTCGEKEQRSVLLKQRLSGDWDVVELDEKKQ